MSYTLYSDTLVTRSALMINNIWIGFNEGEFVHPQTMVSLISVMCTILKLSMLNTVQQFYFFISHNHVVSWSWNYFLLILRFFTKMSSAPSFSYCGISTTHCLAIQQYRKVWTLKLVPKGETQIHQNCIQNYLFMHKIRLLTQFWTSRPLCSAGSAKLLLYCRQYLVDLC